MFTLHHCADELLNAEEVHVTHWPSVIAARGDRLGRLGSITDGGHQSRRRTLKSSNHELLRSWKWWLRTTGRPPAEWQDQERPITTHLSKHGHADWHTAVWCSSRGTPGSDSAGALSWKGPTCCDRKRREGNQQGACLVIRKHQLFRLPSHRGRLRDFEGKTQATGVPEKGGSGHHLHSGNPPESYSSLYLERVRALPAWQSRSTQGRNCHPCLKHHPCYGIQEIRGRHWVPCHQGRHPR